MDDYDMTGVVNSGRRMAEKFDGTLQGHVYDVAACVFELLLTMPKIENQADFWFQLRGQYPHLFGGDSDGE